MDKSTFQKEFLGFEEPLKSYLYRLCTNMQDAEDLCQDAYLKAFEKLDQFKEESSLKTWVFKIASNLALDNFRVQKRWGEDWMDKVKDVHVANPSLMAKKMEVQQSSEYGTFVISEHINYCFNCTSKTLPLIGQLCLWLKEVYEFKISEICSILELGEGKVKHALADARKDMIRIFEKRCALINKKGICSQCTGLNQIYNPKQDAQVEANKLKLHRERDLKNYEELLDLRMAIVKSLDPLQEQGRDLHNYLLENSPNWAENFAQ